MKKLILILAAISTIACSKESTSNENANETASNFLISKLNFVDTNVTPANLYRYEYNYNSNNQPVNMYASNEESADLVKTLEFNYNNDGLTSIVHLNRELILDGVVIAGYEKHVFSYFDENGAESDTFFYDLNDNLITTDTVVKRRFVFEGKLMKSKTFIKPQYSLITKYHHDDDQKLISITTQFVGYEEVNSVTVTAWEDNARADTFGPLEFSLEEEQFWFPTHYISKKNPSEFSIIIGSPRDIMVSYNYDSNENVENQTSTYIDVDYSTTVEKEYTPEN